MRRFGISKTAKILIVVVVVLVAVGAAVAVLPLISPSSGQNQSNVFRVGYIGEGGKTTTWNEANILGLQQAIAAMNSSSRPITLTISADVPYNPTDMQNALSAFSQSHYNLIVFGLTAFYPQLVDTANKNPGIMYLANSLPKANTTNNLSTIGWNTWQGYYPAGVLAGLMTKSNTIGFITAFFFPQTAEGYNAFAAGAKSVNSKVKVLHAATSDWGDPTKGAAATSSMISAGADVVVGMGDGMTDGIIKQAQSSGIYSMGYLFDESALAPKAVAANVVWNTTIYYRSALQAAFSNQFGHNDWEYGITDHVIGVQLTSIVPSSTAGQVNQVSSQAYSGSLRIPDNSTSP